MYDENKEPWTYIHTYIVKYIQTDRQTDRHTYVRECMYVHSYINTYKHTNIHTHISEHTYTHSYIHTYIHTHTQSYIHTYIHTYIVQKKSSYVMVSIKVISMMIYFSKVLDSKELFVFHTGTAFSSKWRFLVSCPEMITSWRDKTKSESDDRLKQGGNIMMLTISY